MFNAELAEIASVKMRTGALMSLDETAAVLGVSSITVHRLPIPSIRLGHSLRFDPRDVAQYIEHSKEPIAA